MRNCETSGTPYVLEAWNRGSGECGFWGLRRNAKSDGTGKGPFGVHLGVQKYRGTTEKRKEYSEHRGHQRP